MLSLIDRDLSFFQTSLGVRAQRQEVLSANIANADTPNFKARDFDFRAALKGKIDGSIRLGNTQLLQTSPRHLPAQAIRPFSAALLYRHPAQLSLDGNTVEMDQERVQFADNTLHYQSTVSFVSAKIRSMQMAIQE